MRWAGNVAHMREMEMHTKFWLEKPEGKKSLERPGRGWKSITIDLRGRGYGLDSSGLVQGPVPGCCEHGNEPSGSIEVGDFFD